MGSLSIEEVGSSSANGSSLLRRKVEFHLARKPISYRPACSSSDFNLETLGPAPTITISASTSASAADPCRQNLTSKSSDHSFGFELSLRMPLKRIGAGLENLGNTCFLNSVVQCLTYTEPLAAYLQSGKHQSSCHIAGFCALCAIQKHVSRALESSGRSLAPKDLVSNLRCISRSFRNARQEDAHEYMIQLLESMHKCCLPSGVATESPSAYEKSLVHKIFGGRLRSQVKCLQCSHCSNKFDPFLDLSLEIMKADTLDKALSHFTAPEYLDGGQKQYNCERCKHKVKALKQLTVHTAPYVLSIHLKRFGSIFTGQKIDKKVQFGSAMNLKPFVSGPYEGDLKYTLYGVLVHAGWSTHSGHYYCFVRTSNGMWYSLDDNRVYQVSEKTVLNQKAYMLFYVRDKKNVTPKKPVEVIQRGTTKSVPFSIAQNRSSAIPLNKCERDSGLNGSVSKLLYERNKHNLPVQQNGPRIESVVEARSSIDPDQKCNGTTLSKCSALATVVLKPGDQALVTVSPSVKCGDETPNVSHSATAAGSCSMDAKLSVDDATVTPQAELHHVAVEVSNSSRTDDKHAVSNNIDHPESTCQKLHSRPSDSHSNRAPDHDKMSNQATTTFNKIESATISPEIASGRVTKAKMKKKLSMTKCASMRLGKNILFGTSLGLRKKKKHKKTKRRAKNSYPISVIGEHIISADAGPSVSRTMTSTTGPDSKHSCERDAKSFSREKDVVSADKNVRKRSESIKEEKCKVRPDGQCRNNSCSLLCGEPLKSGEPAVRKACVKDEFQTVAISTVDHVLNETKIGQWEGMEPPEIPELKGSDNFHIGHVLDEWDTEYDLGKRKKLRQSKIEFGGSNPFQEIAMKKAKLK